MIKLLTGKAQTLVCDSAINQPLCPGTVAKCTCTVTGSGSTTRWKFSTLNPCPIGLNLINLAQPSPCIPDESTYGYGQCGSFLYAANNNQSSTLPCQISTLSVTANVALNGLAFECRDLTFGLPGTFIGGGNISIAG